MSRLRYINEESGHQTDNNSCQESDQENDDYDDDDSFIDNTTQVDDEIIETPTKRKRLTTKSSNEEKEPGDETFPVNCFSLTISKTKGNCRNTTNYSNRVTFLYSNTGDVPLPLLEVIHSWIVQHCVKGGIATEVGKRAFNFHLQGLLQIRFPKTKPFVTRLAKIIRSLVPKQRGYKLMLKPLQGAQTLSAMIGKYLFYLPQYIVHLMIY